MRAMTSVLRISVSFGHRVNKELTYSALRSFASSQNASKGLKNEKRKDSSKDVTPPSDSKKSGTDWIGPPDRDSNLRPIKLHVPSDETPLERDYRSQREFVMKWNQDYWSKHNKKFTKEKNEFITQKLAELGHTLPNGSKRQLTAEEISEFYKQFLDENYQAHKMYNKEWYKKNISLLWPALKIAARKKFSFQKR